VTATEIASVATTATTATNGAHWQPTACILCECNCGIEVRLGGADGRHFERIRGDKAHPSSKGYTCEKALRLDHYQNGRHRLTGPLKRRPDGNFEAVDWETAIAEIAARFNAVRAAYGGESIFYYGGGGQGNHLGGAYSGATLRALGARFRSNALAQEKTGEFWVNARMLGTNVRGDFEHAEVALFVGKNPWQSHGLAHARTTLKEIARDPQRALIVIDPRRSETAELADIHLAVRPGTDAWCLAALVAVLVQEKLVDRAWLAEHADGLDDVERAFSDISIGAYATICGLPEDDIRATARRIAAASSVAAFEDLGIQMNRHSSLSSYVEKLLWLLTGNFAKTGGQYSPTSVIAIGRGDERSGGGGGNVSPVAGARIIGGLVPCNVIADEILTEHPARYRAMLVESANPAHSLAESGRMREALSSLELLVVIDVAMTETARLADYVLPAPSQYEKWEATFFNFESPANVFHLRRPLLAAPEGTLPEPEIHARLVEALGELDESELAPLREAAARGRGEFAAAFFEATSSNPRLGALAPIVLYRTLGPTLPDGAAAAAILWGASHRCAQSFPDALRRAGFTGEGLEPGERLFDAILASPSGLVFSLDEPDDSWRRVRTSDGKVHLAIPELLAELPALAEPPALDEEYPLVLTAGERRSFTANTIFRDPAWRKRDAGGSLRLSPVDASRLGIEDGGRARLTTRQASVEVVVEITDVMQPGHVSLPNGLGVDYPDDEGLIAAGVAPNELTSAADRDWLAGTPWHKYVPSRLETIAEAAS
jgi:anaerobic selenocysteine-containing dehydrogenase